MDEKWDVAGGGGKKEAGKSVSTFYVTNFGNSWKARDLLFEFKELGDVDEVVIPPRRDKRGSRYGFVRFQNVANEKLMAIKLDSLMLEGRKIFVNISRFQRQMKVPCTKGVEERGIW